MIVFEHIENMSIAQINQIPVGSLVTRVSSDTNTLSDLFTNTIVNMIKNVLLLIGVVIVMYIIDYRIASILLCFLPIIAIISFVFRKYSRQNYRKVRHSFSVMNAFLNENISGMKITQIFNQEERKIDEFNKLNGDILTARKTDIKIFAIFRPLITLTYYLALAAVFGFGTYFYLKDVELNLTTIALAIGVIQMFYSLVSKFFDPIQQLADQLNSLHAKDYIICLILNLTLEIVREQLMLIISKGKSNLKTFGLLTTMKIGYYKMYPSIFFQNKWLLL